LDKKLEAMMKKLDKRFDEEIGQALESWMKKVDKRLDDMEARFKSAPANASDSTSSSDNQAQASKVILDVKRTMEKRISDIEVLLQSLTGSDKAINPVTAASDDNGQASKIAELQKTVEKRLSDFEAMLATASKAAQGESKDSGLDKRLTSVEESISESSEKLGRLKDFEKRLSDLGDMLQSKEKSKADKGDGETRYDNLVKLLEDEWASEHKVRQMYQDRSMEMLSEERRARESDRQIMEQRFATFEKKMWSVLDRQPQARIVDKVAVEAPLPTLSRGNVSISSIPTIPSSPSVPGHGVFAAKVLSSSTSLPSAAFQPLQQRVVPSGTMVFVDRSNSSSPIRVRPTTVSSLPARPATVIRERCASSSPNAQFRDVSPDPPLAGIPQLGLSITSDPSAALL
jgi:hypothetical protein